MEVIIAQNAQEIAVIAADLIERQLLHKPNSVLGLATGSTPVGTYRELIRRHKEKGLDFSKVTTFNLDEYVGLPPTHSQSYRYFMEENLFKHINVPPANIHVPYGHADSVLDFCAWYEEEIKRAGGIDLQIIGVGGRGHVAFHESGIPFKGSSVLLVKLDDNTVANAVADGHFASKKDSPQYAVSMGAGLVYKAKTVMLLANGERKLEPITRSILDKPTAEIPISYGQIYSEKGGNLIYVLDRIAGRELLANRQALKARGIRIREVDVPAPAGAALTA